MTAFYLVYCQTISNSEFPLEHDIEILSVSNNKNDIQKEFDNAWKKLLEEDIVFLFTDDNNNIDTDLDSIEKVVYEDDTLYINDKEIKDIDNLDGDYYNVIRLQRTDNKIVLNMHNTDGDEYVKIWKIIN